MIALGHFLMNNTTSGRHPLHISGRNGPAISHAVTVLDRASQDIGYGLDATMRVPGKTRQIIFRNVIPKIVEEQEWIEVFGVTETKSATKMHTGTFNSWLGLDNSLYRSDGHGDSY
jgi:hypothetical protein